MREAVAKLWTGIEALFPSVDSELRYRLAVLIASLLEPRGPSRKGRYDAIKRLYDRRSKAVHGTKMTDDHLRTTMEQSYLVLRDLIVRVLDKGQMFTDSELEDLVLT